MADQVAISLPKTVVLEEDSFPATAFFRVRATKASSTPTTVRYRIDCLRTGVVIRDWTTVSAAASVTITVASTDNEIQDDAARFERRQMIVQADNGLSTQVNGRAIWRVTNLQGIT